MYTPKPAPENLTVQVLWQELNQIKSVLQTLLTDQISLGTTYGEPQKPQPGRIYYADGTTWDPGYGEGGYIYINDEWWPLVTITDTRRARPGYLSLTGYAPYTHLDVIYVKPPAGQLSLRGQSIACGGYFRDVVTVWDCGATTWDAGSTIWDAYVGEAPKDKTVSLSAYAPSIGINIPYTREISSTNLALTSFAPIATHDRVIEINDSNLTLTSSAPSVSVTV